MKKKKKKKKKKKIIIIYYLKTIKYMKIIKFNFFFFLLELHVFKSNMFN